MCSAAQLHAQVRPLPMSMGRAMYCCARYQRYSRTPGGRSGRDTVSKQAEKASEVRTSRSPVPRCMGCIGVRGATWAHVGAHGGASGCTVLVFDPAGA